MTLPRHLLGVVLALLFSATSAWAVFPTPVSLNGLDANEQATIAPINSQYQTAVPFGFSPPLGLAVQALPAGAQAGAISQLSPEKLGVFTSSVAFNNASFEMLAMDDYLAGQRQGRDGSFLGGNGSIDVSGLSVNNPDVDPVFSRFTVECSPESGPGQRMLSDVPTSMAGGMDMKDTKDVQSTRPGNPWNVFVRGNVVLAQGLSKPGCFSFDDNTESVVVGADYRITPHFLVGLTASYAHTDATLDDQGSSATSIVIPPGPMPLMPKMAGMPIHR